jgi:hypothetical protein
MASISRKLQIASKDQLYKAIDAVEELSSNKIFSPFMDSMRDHYYGCRCDAEYYDNRSSEEYRISSTDENITSALKEYFECSDIEFL